MNQALLDLSGANEPEAFGSLTLYAWTKVSSVARTCLLRGIQACSSSNSCVDCACWNGHFLFFLVKAMRRLASLLAPQQAHS